MQNRAAPAFQEYAAAMMATVPYRVLSLAERGLLYSMRLECWVNHGLPENPATLARILAFDVAEVAAALPAVMPFFSIQNGQIISPELDDYRKHIEGIRIRQSEGGKQSAANKKDKNRATETKSIKGVHGSQATCKSLAGQPQVLSSVQSSQAKPSQKQSLDKGISAETSAWVGDYERASNGQ